MSYARCCRPIPGDGIVGLFSRGRGIVIHRPTCPNAREQSKRPDTWIGVEWSDDIKSSFEADIRLEVVNRRGVFATLASVIAEEDSNINHVLVTARDDRNSAIRFTIEVYDRKHLARIIRRLRARRSVIRHQHPVAEQSLFYKETFMIAHQPFTATKHPMRSALLAGSACWRHGLSFRPDTDPQTMEPPRETSGPGRRSSTTTRSCRKPAAACRHRRVHHLPRGPGAPTAIEVTAEYFDAFLAGDVLLPPGQGRAH